MKYPVKSTVALLLVISLYATFLNAMEDDAIGGHKTEPTSAGVGGEDRKGETGDRMPPSESPSPEEDIEIDEDEIIDKLTYEMAWEAMNGDRFEDATEIYGSDLVREKLLVDYYVVQCENNLFSVNVWKELSQEELYHIRNGIFAFCGYHFKSGYYDLFTWYEGGTEPEDFQWKVFNESQYRNVINICYVEEERENNEAE